MIPVQYPATVVNSIYKAALEAHDHYRCAHNLDIMSAYCLITARYLKDLREIYVDLSDVFLDRAVRYVGSLWREFQSRDNRVNGDYSVDMATILGFMKFNLDGHQQVRHACDLSDGDQNDCGCACLPVSPPLPHKRRHPFDDDNGPLAVAMSDIDGLVDEISVARNKREAVTKFVKKVRSVAQMVVAVPEYIIDKMVVAGNYLTRKPKPPCLALSSSDPDPAVDTSMGYDEVDSVPMEASELAAAIAELSTIMKGVVSLHENLVSVVEHLEGSLVDGALEANFNKACADVCSEVNVGVGDASLSSITE
jgi:hypothetical protein